MRVATSFFDVETLGSIVNRAKNMLAVMIYDSSIVASCLRLVGNLPQGF